MNKIVDINGKLAMPNESLYMLSNGMILFTEEVNEINDLLIFDSAKTVLIQVGMTKQGLQAQMNRVDQTALFLGAKTFTVSYHNVIRFASPDVDLYANAIKVLSNIQIAKVMPK